MGLLAMRELNDHKIKDIAQHRDANRLPSQLRDMANRQISRFSVYERNLILKAADALDMKTKKIKRY